MVDLAKMAKIGKIVSRGLLQEGENRKIISQITPWTFWNFGKEKVCSAKDFVGEIVANRDILLEDYLEIEDKDKFLFTKALEIKYEILKQEKEKMLKMKDPICLVFYVSIIPSVTESVVGYKGGELVVFFGESPTLKWVDYKGGKDDYKRIDR